MDAQAAIHARYGFALPELYGTLLAGGHFSLPWKNYLVYYDFEWLPLEEIAAYKFWNVNITHDGGFVPFGISGRHDEWCWRLDWAIEAEPPVVFCEWGDAGFGYAPDFRGFLYRKTLEEFGGYNDLGAGGDGKFADLQRAVAMIAIHLPGRWATRLRELAGHDLDQWQKDKYGNVYVLPKDELEALIAEELAFPHLNETFEQDKERAKRSKQ